MTLLDFLRPLPVFEEADPPKSPVTPPAPPATPPVPPKTPTALDAGDPPSDPGRTADLPETWRTFMGANDDELAELNRFKSPKDIGKALLEQKKQLRKGADAAEPAPDGKDPEALKKWRTDRGIPLAATDYKIPETIKAKVTDVDKPIVDGYFAFMHNKNASQKEIDSGLEYYYGLQEASQADRAEADKALSSKTADTMRGVWGADFRRNAQIAKRAASEMIDGVDWFSARLPDGTPLGSVPAVMEFLYEEGLKRFGDGAYEGGEAGGDSASTEFEALKKAMNTDMKAWRRNTAGQKRYQELKDLMDKRQR